MQNLAVTGGRDVVLGRRRSAFTIVEVLVSILIVAFTVSSLVTGWILSAKKTEWSSLSSAAQRLALRRVEQARAARWDLFSHPPTNEVVRLAGVETVPLEVPRTDTNRPTATVETTIEMVSGSPPLQLIRVDVVWSYLDRGPFTNTVITYRAPDS